MSGRRLATSLCALACLFAILVSGPGAHAANVRLTPSYVWGLYPGGDADIYGDIVVHTDSRYRYVGPEDPWTRTGHIYLYDIASGLQRDLGLLPPKDYEGESVRDPHIWGTKAAYVFAGTDGDCQVRLLDLVTGARVDITGRGGGGWCPAISEDWVVWLDEDDVFVCDVNTTDAAADATRIRNHQRHEGPPSVWGDSVVFSARAEGSTETAIVHYDITSKQETTLTASGRAVDPVVWGDTVAYVDTRDGYPAVYSYDLVTQVETAVTSVAATHRGGLDIYEDKVVYADDRFGSLDVYCYDVTSGTETRLTSGSGDESEPKIWGSRVIYRAGAAWPELWLYDPGPEARVGTPQGPSKVGWGKRFSIAGDLEPAHPRGTRPVFLHLWKRTAAGVEYGQRREEWTWYGVAQATATSATAAPSRSVYRTLDHAFGFRDFMDHDPANPTGLWRIRAYLTGDASHAPAWSPGYLYVTVTDVIVGTPNAPERMRDDTKYTVHGILKPRHASGSKPVELYKYKRLANGYWDYRGHTHATVRNYGTYSRYSAKMTFSSPGRWRVRAYHPEDAGHRARYSDKYDYVTVTR